MIFFFKNNKFSYGAKHMELKYIAINDESQKQRVSIKHISTKLMIANPLTKGLPLKKYKQNISRMGLE